MGNLKKADRLNCIFEGDPKVVEVNWRLATFSKFVTKVIIKKRNNHNVHVDLPTSLIQTHFARLDNPVTCGHQFWWPLDSVSECVGLCTRLFILQVCNLSAALAC